MEGIFGIRPASVTRQMIEKFEEEVLIRHNNQYLTGSVDSDRLEDRWAVAVACIVSTKTGIHGHGNAPEVRYSCPSQGCSSIRVFRSDEPSERTLATEPLKDGDAFIRNTLMQERTHTGKAV